VNIVLVFVAAVIALSQPLAAQNAAPASPSPSASSSKSKGKTSTKGKASAVKGAASSSKGTPSKTKAKSTASKRKTTPARTVRSYQQAPTPERYQEIQEALVKKGYFQGQADGHWGTDSVDALKRFQAEQNLMPDGKINSLSLIALGLGAKRLSAQSKPAGTAPAQSPAPQ